MQKYPEIRLFTDSHSSQLRYERDAFESFTIEKSEFHQQTFYRLKMYPEASWLYKYMNIYIYTYIYIYIYIYIYTYI